MRSPVLEITGIRYLPAGAVGQRVGVLGHVTCTVNGALILGLTLRRTEAGRVYLAYPAHRDRHGRQHHPIRPIDNRTREEVERQVLAELRRQGRLAS